MGRRTYLNQYLVYVYISNTDAKWYKAAQTDYKSTWHVVINFYPSMYSVKEQSDMESGFSEYKLKGNCKNL